MKTTTIKLDDDILARIVAEKKAKGATIRHIIQTALREYFSNMDKTGV